MSSFSKFAERVKVLGNRIREEIRNSACVEDAASTFSRMVFEEFPDSLVLSRVFICLPFQKIPDFNKDFVLTLARAKNILSQIKDDTPVLSLLGTHGRSKEWNHRKNSKEHLGIPLVSEAFLESIPMMCRLLKELGISLDWLRGYDTSIVTKKMGRLSGLFYVQDAATALDEKGRKIISAQDFVQDHGIRTVFGMGGGYSKHGIYTVMIIFTNKNLPHRGAELFMRYANLFNGETGRLVLKDKIFRP